MKKIIIILAISLIIFGIFLRVISLDKDFTGEETDFVSPAIAISQTGHPIFYHSEQQPREIALWHPPMYIFLMGLIFKISFSEMAARSINFIFSILTAILIFLFCKNILTSKGGKEIGLIASVFFLFNYYILSSSIIIDIDIFSTFFVFGFIYFVIMYSQENKKSYFIFSALFLLFGLANRYPMTILAYVGIGIYYSEILKKPHTKVYGEFPNPKNERRTHRFSDFKKESKNYFKKYLLIGILASLIFVLIWGVYSTLIEPGNFLSFIKHNSKFGISQFSDLKIYIASFLLNISQFVRLFTIPATILMLSSFIYFFKRKEKEIRTLLIYILSILIFFLIVPRPAFGYPRYFMTIFPGVSILISLFLWENLNEKKFGKKEYVFSSLIFILSFLFLIIFNPQLTNYESDGLILATNIPDFLFNISASIPFILFLFMKDKRKFLILALIALMISYSLFFNFKFINYNSHIKETGEYLNSVTSDDDILIVPKAIGFYSERRYYVNENNKPLLDLSPLYLLNYIQKSYENRKMNEEFFWPGGIYGRLYLPQPSNEELSKVSYVVLYYPAKGIEYERKIGDFYIYNVR